MQAHNAGSNNLHVHLVLWALPEHDLRSQSQGIHRVLWELGWRILDDRLAHRLLPHRRSFRGSQCPSLYKLFYKEVNSLLVRQILIIFNIVALIATGLLHITNIGLLLALRIIQGFVVGVFMAIVPMYVNELVPIDLHGSEGVISQILIVVGVVIDYIFKVAFTASGANLELYWRFVFTFTGLPILIQLFCLLFRVVPESPMSLIK